MINPADFGEGEFEAAKAQLHTFQQNEEQLSEEVMKYFNQYDTDGNAWLDRRELRQFLVNFFGSYHIRVPITDEYVDAVFRSIDQNHDNKLQPEELLAFAKAFIGRLVTEFDQARVPEPASPSSPAEEEKK